MKRYICIGIAVCVSLMICGCSHGEAGTVHGTVPAQERAEEESEEIRIPAEDPVDFDEQKNEASMFTVTQKGRLREDMPEFTFVLTAYRDIGWGSYALQSLEVREGDTVLQTIAIPELTVFGQTQIYDSMEDTLGFELEDVNFDGYLDIRQYDAPNGNYREEWIYLVWDPGENRFEHDVRLNQISLATFDQVEQLIYGMERSGAACHYYSTYQP